MATIIPRKGQVVLSKKDFDRKLKAGELIPGTEYLVGGIAYVTTEELNATAKALDSKINITKEQIGATVSKIDVTNAPDTYVQTLNLYNLDDVSIGTVVINIPKPNLEIVENTSLFTYTFTLKDSNGNILGTKTIDLPLESVVVNGSYDKATKTIKLTLQNGNLVSIPVGDIVSGLATTAQVNAKADQSVVDGIGSRVSALETTANTLGTKNTEQDNKIKAIETKNTEQDSRLTTIETKNDEQDSKIKAIETKNTEQQAQIDDLSDRIVDGLGTVVNVGRQAQQSVDFSSDPQTQIDDLSAKNTAQDNKIKAIETKNTEQDTTIANKANQNGAYLDLTAGKLYCREVTLDANIDTGDRTLSLFRTNNQTANLPYPQYGNLISVVNTGGERNQLWMCSDNRFFVRSSQSRDNFGTWEELSKKNGTLYVKFAKKGSEHLSYMGIDGTSTYTCEGTLNVSDISVPYSVRGYGGYVYGAWVDIALFDTFDIPIGAIHKCATYSVSQTSSSHGSNIEFQVVKNQDGKYQLQARGGALTAAGILMSGTYAVSFKPFAFKSWYNV